MKAKRNMKFQGTVGKNFRNCCCIYQGQLSRWIDVGEYVPKQGAQLSGEHERNLKRNSSNGIICEAS